MERPKEHNRKLEVIEWSNMMGLTRLGVNDDTGEEFAQMFIPKPVDAKSRTVGRHELLHALYDSPDDYGDQQPAMYTSFDVAEQAIGDVFVHVVYWPDDDPEADADALESATGELQEIVDHIHGDRLPQIAELMLVTLRSAAVIKRVGTVEDQLKASNQILTFISAEQLAAMNQIIKLVEDNNRKGAVSKFTELVDSVSATAEWAKNVR